MLTAFMFAATLAAMTPAAPIGQQSCHGGDAAACAAIIKGEQALTHMLLTADPKPLATLLDERAVWMTPNGASLTKAQIINAIGRDTPKASAALDSLTITFFGDTAIANWAESWTDAGAAATPGRMTGTDIWVRRGGTWKLIGLQEARPAS
jgi:hypothetical protein